VISGPLSIELQPEGDQVVLRLAGEIDADSCAALDAALAGLPPDRDHVTLDLGGVTFMDSTGIAEIIRAAQPHEPGSRVVRLRNPHPHVRRLLELTGLTDLCTE
jgi:anti-anti-sigma factor